jgi:hypothetical protein
MSKTFLRHTLTFLFLTTYLYTFSLYENPSFIIFSAETDYISTRSWYRNINFLRDRIRRICFFKNTLNIIKILGQLLLLQLLLLHPCFNTFCNISNCFCTIFLYSFHGWVYSNMNKTKVAYILEMFLVEILISFIQIILL